MSKHFRPGQQHDSHELLRTIVDMMKKDQTRAFRLAIMDKFGVKKKGQDSDPQMVSLVSIYNEEDVKRRNAHNKVVCCISCMSDSF